MLDKVTIFLFGLLLGWFFTYMFYTVPRSKE